MDDSKQILQMLGKIDGKLEGLEHTVDSNHAAINQRLNDIQKSNEQRFDGIERSVDERLKSIENNIGARLDTLEERVGEVEDEQKNMIWKIAGWSGLSGALVTGVVELLKNAK